MGVVCISGIFIATRRGEISTQSIKKAQGKSHEELHNRGELTKVDRKVMGRSERYHVHYNDWKTVPSKTEVFLMRGQITASWENCSWLLA